MDFFKKVISTVSVATGSGIAPNFPYVIDQELSPEARTNGVWTIHSGHRAGSSKKDASAQVTIFIANLVKDQFVAVAARNALKRLKTLRHPKILRLIDGVEVDGKIYIATESVTPFQMLEAEISGNHDWILWIILGLLETLRFINDEAKTIYGNLRRNSLFLTKTGEIRLMGFELASSITEENPLVIDPSRYLRGSDLNDWPPEIRSSGWNKLRSNPIHSIDSWMLARLISQIAKVSLPGTLKEFCQNAQSVDPQRRKSFILLLEPSICHKTFACPLVAVDQLLERLNCADSLEKDRLFNGIKSQLHSLPNRFLIKKLLPMVILSLELQSDSIEGLKLIFDLSPKLEKETFERDIVPFIVRLFEKTDRAIRLLLLDNIKLIMDTFPEKIIQNSIFGHFCAGFADTLAELREVTLKASVVLIPKLTSRQISNDLIRHYSRLQSDEQPGIRVNALICLGKISDKLEPTVKLKIFIAAISRALQDPFPPARHSGLLVLSSMVESFPSDILAKNFLPVISPILLDKDLEVKAKAFATIRQILQHLESKNPVQCQNKAIIEPRDFGKALSPVVATSLKSRRPTLKPNKDEDFSLLLSPSNDIQSAKVGEKFGVISPAVKQSVIHDDGWDGEELIDIKNSSREEQDISVTGLNLGNDWADSSELDPWASS